LEISGKGVAVGGILATHRGEDALDAEGAEPAQTLSVAESHRGRLPLPARAAAIASRHAGQHRAFIDEHQAVWCDPAKPGGLICLPVRARLHEVVTVLLSGLDAAFLSRPVQPAQRTPNGPGIDP